MNTEDRAAHMTEPLQGEDPAAPNESIERELPLRFYVTGGDATVGPVDGELLARGIEAGRVPLDALVWCTGWERWLPVAEYAQANGLLPNNEKAKANARLARVSDLQPLQLPSTDLERQTLSAAKDLAEAASVFLAQSAAATGAECGWVHVVSRAAGGAMVTHEGLGPRAHFGVGRTIDASDQALRVAREGRTVLGEPIPGVVGSAVTARILATGVSATSVLMTPVLCSGQLIAMVELGVASRLSGFSARDAAIVEQIARDFGAIARKRGWHR